MELALFALIGVCAGALARFLVPAREAGGIVVTGLVGMMGALLGGLLGRLLASYGAGTRTTWALAVTGSIALLVGYRLVLRRGATGPTHA